MLKLEKISKYYTSNEQVVKALDQVSMSFEAGEFVVITGESGSGKSTLLNVISGLDSFEDGELYINDEETSYFDTEDWENYRKKYVGFIFQRFNIIDAYTVYENVLLALKLSNYPKKEQKSRALELIEAVGLTPQKNQKSSKLSGGQKQRVAIARALAKNAPIIVADEPTGNLDQETSQKILNLLKEVARDKLVILVSHNAEEVKSIATRHIRIFDGKVQEDKIIKKTPTVAQSMDAEVSKKNQGTLFNIALKNLFSMPKRTLLVGMISVFIVAVFMLSYGSYVDQSNTIGFSFNPVFSSPSPHRLVVTNVDGSPLTGSDIQTFRNTNGVLDVVTFDPVLDLYLNQRDSRTPDFVQPFRMMSAVVLNERDLVEGRLPENPFEVVMPEPSGFGRFDNQYQVGDVIEMYVSHLAFSISSTRERTDEFTIVGIHNQSLNRWPQTLYLDSEFLAGPVLRHQALANVHQVSLYSGTTFLFNLERSFNLYLDDSLPEDAIYINGIETDGRLIPEFFPGLTRSEFLEMDFQLHAKNAFDHDPKVTTFKFTGALSNPAIDERYGIESLIIAHPSAWAQFLNLDTYQMALIVEDTFAARSVRAQLPNQYHAIYPSAYQDSFEAVFNVIGNVFQIFSTIFILIVMYFVAYIALKNVMKSRQKDYVIMRSIGASKLDLISITIYELVMMMAVAFILVYGTLMANQVFAFGLPDYLRFYTPVNYVTAFLLLSFLMVFLGLRFNKKIFTQTVQTALRGE
jgi:ABC-type lipoprotein export system ATPase subunit